VNAADVEGFLSRHRDALVLEGRIDIGRAAREGDRVLGVAGVGDAHRQVARHAREQLGLRLDLQALAARLAGVADEGGATQADVDRQLRLGPVDPVDVGAQVVAAAVESLRGSEATALVYTNTTSTTPQSNNIPSLKYLSYRLELQREGRQWRVTKMSTVTSLDLTPKL
jgi:hypothetical protein